MNQHDYVSDCLALYTELNLEPGNPMHGEWHLCHYPKPKCLGGTETIFLLKKHHAHQGPLQSEEYNHPCIWGWEGEYLSGEILEVWKKWMTKKLEIGLDKMSQSERAQQAGRNTVENELGWYNPVIIERRKRATRVSGLRAVEEGTGIHGLPDRERSENCRKGGLAAAKVQQERGTGIFGLTYEDRVAIAEKSNKDRKIKVVLTHPDGTEEVVDSISEAVRKYNLNKSQLYKILRGQTTGTSKGFSIRYYSDQP
jgi:hypothetical protein